LAGGAAGVAVLLPLHASETPIQEISPLVWVMVAISAAGAFITYAIMVYAVWRFRDPSTKRRNYG
jgi:amino acid transporter